jgi:hypothetical protein
MQLDLIGNRACFGGDCPDRERPFADVQAIDVRYGSYQAKPGEQNAVTVFVQLQAPRRTGRGAWARGRETPEAGALACM